MAIRFDDDTLELERALERAMERDTKRSAKRIEKKAEVPVKTGNLRDSAYIGETVSVEGHSATTLGYEAEYASFVHDGYTITDKTDPEKEGRFVQGRPFLTNAINNDDPQLEDDVAQSLLKLGCTRVDRF